eukprot:1194638-Prorocentrum_minimum.AAC.1
MSCLPCEVKLVFPKVAEAAKKPVTYTPSSPSGGVCAVTACPSASPAPPARVAHTTLPVVLTCTPPPGIPYPDKVKLKATDDPLETIGGCVHLDDEDVGVTARPSPRQLRGPSPPPQLEVRTAEAARHVRHCPASGHPEGEIRLAAPEVQQHDEGVHLALVGGPQLDGIPEGEEVAEVAAHHHALARARRRHRVGQVALPAAPGPHPPHAARAAQLLQEDVEAVVASRERAAAKRHNAVEVARDGDVRLGVGGVVQRQRRRHRHGAACGGSASGTPLPLHAARRVALLDERLPAGGATPRPRQLARSRQIGVPQAVAGDVVALPPGRELASLGGVHFRRHCETTRRGSGGGRGRGRTEGDAADVSRAPLAEEQRLPVAPHRHAVQVHQLRPRAHPVCDTDAPACQRRRGAVQGGAAVGQRRQRHLRP